MFRSILIITLSLVMVASILAPSVVLLSHLKVELLGLEDFSEEEKNNSEKEIQEKEIILHAYQKHELFLFELNTVLNRFRQDHTLACASDIFLPPPEHS